MGEREKIAERGDTAGIEGAVGGRREEKRREWRTATKN